MIRSAFLGIVFIPFFCTGQMGHVWTFGHNAAIDFSSGIPVPDSSAVVSRGSCASISDSTGQLLFYAAYDADVYTNNGPPYKGGEVYNKQHQLMQNGDLLVMELWYKEVVIIPSPANTNQYYVFCVGVTGGNIGLYFSVVDMSLNGGLGAVIQKNVQLPHYFKMTDGLTAVKHGNGRDWWIFFRRWVNGFDANDEFHSYLISPNGITNYTLQNIGTPNGNGFARMYFTPDGNNMMLMTYYGLLEYYDFNRCTGILSNPQTIFPDPTITGPLNYFWDGAFSPSGNLYYIIKNAATCHLLQYDLTASNIPASVCTLWTTTFPLYTMGGLKLAPDNKIYVSSTYYDGANFPYPYPDTVYNMYNMNLGVINSPDNVGTGCNFQPYSFYLGGKRTYAGLPNNPDYELPALAGSICDTLSVGVSENGLQTGHPELLVTYVAGWQKIFVNAQNLHGKNAVLQVHDVTGKLIYSSAGSPLQVNGGYVTIDVNCISFASGMYIVWLHTENEFLAKKFMKE